MLIEAPVVLILSLALQVLSLATQGGKLELPALCGQSPSESPVLYSETRPTNAEIDAREQGCWYMQEHAQTKSCKRPKLPGPSLCPKYDADSKIVNSGTGRQPRSIVRPRIIIAKEVMSSRRWWRVTTWSYDSG